MFRPCSAMCKEGTIQ